MDPTKKLKEIKNKKCVEIEAKMDKMRQIEYKQNGPKMCRNCVVN